MWNPNWDWNEYWRLRLEGIKMKKKITLWKPVVKNREGEYRIPISGWCEEKYKKSIGLPRGIKVVGWVSKEVEVDE
jgi:hypothetical protein